MTFYSAPFKAPKSLLGELLAPVDVFVDLLKLVNIDIGFTLSEDLKKEYGAGAKAIFIDMAVSLFKPATLFLTVLVLAVVAWRPLIGPAINNQLNPDLPQSGMIVPPLVWSATPTPTATFTPTQTVTPTPEPTATPTVTLTPTPTPVVFASEGECDPIPDENPWPFHSSLFKFMFAEKKAFEEWESGPGLWRVETENWLTLLADTPGIKGAYALERAEWEPFLDSNRYCQVNGQWTPLLPYEDLLCLNGNPKICKQD